MPFVVVDVGCMECGAYTTLVGVYEEHHEASQAVSDRRWSRYTRDSWRDGGQARILVFDTDDPDTEVTL